MPRGVHGTRLGGPYQESRLTLREILTGLDTVERVHLQGELSGPLDGGEALEAAGERILTVPAAGQNVMFDKPDAFARAVAGDA